MNDATPKAILLDLDDTILDDSGDTVRCWREACRAHGSELGDQGRLGVVPAGAWMVGDNLEWDVAAPQRLGIRGIWIDARGTGVPPGHAARPDRIIRRLSDLRNGGAS